MQVSFTVVKWFLHRLIAHWQGLICFTNHIGSGSCCHTSIGVWSARDSSRCDQSNSRQRTFTCLAFLCSNGRLLLTPRWLNVFRTTFKFVTVALSRELLGCCVGRYGDALLAHWPLTYSFPRRHIGWLRKSATHHNTLWLIVKRLFWHQLPTASAWIYAANFDWFKTLRRSRLYLLKVFDSLRSCSDVGKAHQSGWLHLTDSLCSLVEIDNVWALDPSAIAPVIFALRQTTKTCLLISRLWIVAALTGLHKMRSAIDSREAFITYSF